MIPNTPVINAANMTGFSMIYCHILLVVVDVVVVEELVVVVEVDSQVQMSIILINARGVPI